MSDSTELYRKLLMQAQSQKLQLNSGNLRKLSKLYNDALEDVIKRASTARGGFTKTWLKDYEKYLRNKMNDLNNEIVNLSTDAIKTSSQIAASVQGGFFSYINDKYDLKVPKEFLSFAYSTNNTVVMNIINGGLYKDNKSLSSRIWGYGEENLKDIQYIINKGMLSQKPYLEIIKDLESYVDPNSKKSFSWKKVYPNINKSVDYNAQRLLRTSINHAFYFTNMQNYKENPFIDAVHWELSSQHFTRQVKHFGEDVCDRYANQNDYNLGTGNFPKNEVPIPHPSCMCFQSAVMGKSLNNIAEELNTWMNGETNKSLDNWYSGDYNNSVNKIDKFKEAYDNWDKKSVKKFAQSLLDEEKLPVTASRKKINANGQCAFNFSGPDMKLLSYELNSTDKRSIEYQVKTAFHELFHANSNGLEHDIGTVSFKEWAYIDDVFAEVTAHYLNQKMGITHEIAPAYPDHLIEALPKLKSLPKFKNCKTITDFGEVAYSYRFSEEKNACWNEINMVLKNTKNDIIKYSSNYTDYMSKNKESLINKLLENMPGYEAYKNNMIDDLKGALENIENGEVLKGNQHMIFENALIITMNRLGVI